MCWYMVVVGIPPRYADIRHRILSSNVIISFFAKTCLVTDGNRAVILCVAA